ITWDNINQFKTSDITPEIQAEFEPKAREIVLGLDTHRPWMMKDPRFCLLLPFWRPLLEIPVCVYVHRSPVQVAQSLKKREDFSMMLGVALWEKYTLQGLANIADIPRILVSHEELMSNPIAAVKKLYQDLLDCEVQGLRLPSEKEIRAFIEPKYFHEHGDTGLQNAYINHQQAILFEAFENASIFQLEPLPTLSEGASEILQAYQERLEAEQETSKLQETLETREQEITERDTEIAKQREEIEQRDNQIAKRDGEINLRDQEIASLKQALETQKALNAKSQSQIASYRNQVLVAENQAIRLQQDIAERQNQQMALETDLTETQNVLTEQEQTLSALFTKTQDKQHHINKLLQWISALNEDITAIFNSLTWRSGNVITQILLKLMFRKAGLTAQDHLKEILTEIAAWQSQIETTDDEPPRHHAVSVMPSVTQTKPVAVTTAPAKALLQQNPRDYPRWIQNYDTLTSKMVKRMQQRIKTWDAHPLISIVMPTYNTPEKWLREAIESVQDQIYPNWELCIADDASSQPHVRRILEEYAKADKRIKIILRTENGHISAASNTALDEVTGEFITFLDHDDKLAKHALFWVVKDILAHPEAILWYSDEDKINEKGERYDPYFKSEWNPDLFLSYNLINHLAVYRTALIQEIAGFREGYEGAQDYDLALRAIEQIEASQIKAQDYNLPLRMIEQIEASQIRHIPRILYHWRAVTGSTATRQDEKPYALTAAQKAISEHLERCDIEARVTEAPNVPGAIRVQYALPADLPLVSLIIPTRNAVDFLSRCVESILEKTDYPNFEIVIVNNESDDPATLAYLTQLEQNEKARIIDYPHPFNYAEINNMAVEQVEGELIGLLNNDLEVISPDWLSEMVSHALRPEIGAVGARLWYPNEILQHGGVILGIGSVAGHSHKYLQRHQFGYFSRACLIQNFSAVTAACLVMRKQYFLAVGGLDAKHLGIAFNDVDFCLKIKALGLRIVWTPYAELYHHESVSRGHENTPKKQARFQKECDYMKSRWGNLLLNDPAYSPNLTLETEDFAYAWPPRVPSII
ncbi:MAG: glycosyltransferase, partial [Candidatus Parabeggiatoa sp.]|nr:glycosyltransferase [Candidatus Parabeggiatoa sp.]